MFEPRGPHPEARFLEAGKLPPYKDTILATNKDSLINVATIHAMILHPHPPGWVAIPQAAHAMLAFQIADHWGNRMTPRPGPRAEVLGAVLLHDSGWDAREEPPALDPEGLPLAFDTWPEGERETLWTAAVERAALRGRYPAYLVSHHVSMLASRFGTLPHDAFLAAEEHRRAALRTDLERDPRYAQVFRTGGDDVNRAVVRTADAIAVHLARGTAGCVALPDVPQRGGPAAIELRCIGDRTYRLRPWPLAGRRLDLVAEGRALPTERFADEDGLHRAWAVAPTLRLSWTLLPTGEPAD